MTAITVTKHHADRVKSLKADIELLEAAFVAVHKIKYIMPNQNIANDIMDEIKYKRAKIAELSN